MRKEATDKMEAKLDKAARMVYVAIRPIAECESFIETMTAKGLDVHAVSLSESGPYVWRHAVARDAVT